MTRFESSLVTKANSLIKETQATEFQYKKIASLCKDKQVRVPKPVTIAQANDTIKKLINMPTKPQRDYVDKLMFDASGKKVNWETTSINTNNVSMIIDMLIRGDK